jgi:Reverse transcriptase (RNA-dependent DNA polymerase)/Endonuclease-reverse transcriptase
MEVYDVLCFNETWLDESITDSLLLNSECYCIIRHDRIGKTGGGIIALIKQGLTVSVIALCQFPMSELIAFDVLCNKLSYRIICAYRPPNGDITDLNNLLGNITSLCVTSAPCVVIGDFNLPVKRWEDFIQSTNVMYTSFTNMLQCNALHQYVTWPTRNDNILDLLCCNDAGIIFECVPADIGLVSDHQAIDFTILIDRHETVSHHSSDYNFKKANYSAISQALSNTNWVNFMHGCVGVNDMWTKFSNYLKLLVERYVPLMKKYKKRRVPKHIKKLYNKKNSLHRRLLNTGNGRNDYAKICRRYKDAVVQHAIQLENEAIYSGDQKQFFKYLNSKTRSRSCIPPLRNENGEIMTQDNVKAEILNNFFSSVFTNDNNINPPFPSRVPSDVSLNSVDISPALVFAVIKSIKPSNSLDPDGFSSNFYYQLAAELCIPLSIIMKTSMDTHELPSAWKSANICAIHKKGMTCDPNNYRPISLTVIACKIMERLIAINLLSYLNTYNLISAEQHGFLARHSTETQLLETFNEWTKALDSHLHVDCVFIDFKKAFDSVCHNKLLIKLAAYGINGNLLGWIKSFLSNRKQRVRVNNCYSEWSNVTSSVPQGSVLGPILFVLYINDIADIVHGCKIKLFADDVKVYWVHNKINDANILQMCLNAIWEWSVVWQLPISCNKCYSMHFGVNNPLTVYKFGDVDIKIENNVKDLGVFVSNNLKNSFHCNKIVDKTKRLCSMLFRCLKSRDPNCLIMAYKSYILPILEYNSSVWSPYLIKDIDNIESVQRNFTWRVFKRCGLPDASYNERLARLQLPSLELRRIHKDLIFCYKIVYGNIALNVSNFFAFANNAHTRGNSLKFFKKQFCLDICKYFFSNRVVDIWNSLSTTCVLSKNVNCFKHNLMSYDFSVFLRGSHKRTVEVPD